MAETDLNTYECRGGGERDRKRDHVSHIYGIPIPCPAGLWHEAEAVKKLLIVGEARVAIYPF